MDLGLPIFDFRLSVNLQSQIENPQSAQRESNPHFRHGKAVGYRYIMSADGMNQLSKNFREHWDSNPRCRITSAVSLPLNDQCWLSSEIGGARTLTCPVKSRMCCR